MSYKAVKVKILPQIYKKSEFIFENYQILLSDLLESESIPTNIVFEMLNNQ